MLGFGGLVGFGVLGFWVNRFMARILCEYYYYYCCCCCYYYYYYSYYYYN